MDGVTGEQAGSDGTVLIVISDTDSQPDEAEHQPQGHTAQESEFPDAQIGAHAEGVRGTMALEDMD